MANEQTYRGATTQNDKPGNAPEGVVERASETVREAVGQVGVIADRAMEQGRNVGMMAKNAPSGMRDAADKSLKEQPIVTLAAAGALGFVLGALWKS